VPAAQGSHDHAGATCAGHDGIDHRCGCGLAVGAGDPDDVEVCRWITTHHRGCRADGCTDIGHHDLRVVDAVEEPFDEQRRSPRRDGLRSEIVSIETTADNAGVQCRGRHIVGTVRHISNDHSPVAMHLGIYSLSNKALDDRIDADSH
jgi:hypothetical protein